MTRRYYHDVIQGSEDWHLLRCGMLTASDMHLILTPTLKRAHNAASRGLINELLAQRVTGHTEPIFIGNDMLRGKCDEILARAAYSEHYAPVTECGFVTSEVCGVTIGYSPDGLVGEDGLIECKSRRAKYQVQTILDDYIPVEYMAQIQTGLLVTGRKWLDFISYSAGLPVFVRRVLPDDLYHKLIVSAAVELEIELREELDAYSNRLAAMPVLIHTERTIEQEMTL